MTAPHFDLIAEARALGIQCPACGALMIPATTTLDWWDCLNPDCESDEQP